MDTGHLARTLKDMYFGRISSKYPGTIFSHCLSQQILLFDFFLLSLFGSSFVIMNYLPFFSQQLDYKLLIGKSNFLDISKLQGLDIISTQN